MLEKGQVDFKYKKEGEFTGRFFADQVSRNGQRGIFIHVSELADHIRVVGYIDKYVIPEFKKFEVKE